ncbi:MAG TPA: hypothetical protein VHZ78_02510 [Rhizomicrobium sp.]|jgi:hypothetical protein|nr:hypothetical protein [Rhizomicrobium sp.]
MLAFERAFQAVAALGLNGANKQLAAHWLSRWRNDAPPTRESFRIDEAWEYSPAIAIFKVQKGQSVLCLSAGSFHQLALGYDVAGNDILSITSADERERRMAWCWEIVLGAATVSWRQYETAGQSKGLAQGMSLPFSDRVADGARYFLMHSNWRPVGGEWVPGTVQADAQTPPQRRIISFHAPRALEVAA